MHALRPDGGGGISRRDVILALAGLATGTPLLRRAPLGASMTEGSRIDLHQHYFPPVAKKRYGPFAAILERCGCSPGELDGICRMNALRVLPHWRSRTHGSQPGRMG